MLIVKVVTQYVIVIVQKVVKLPQKVINHNKAQHSGTKHFKVV